MSNREKKERSTVKTEKNRSNVYAWMLCFGRVWCQDKMRDKDRNREAKCLLIPESVRSEVALTPTGGFQFDKSPTRRIKGAHEGNANAEYH